jgi:hypothetical protein
METRRLIVGMLAIGLLHGQEIQRSIQVTGAVGQPLTLTADDLAKMPRATVRQSNNDIETVYEGVWLHQVLKKAGVPQGKDLRGKTLIQLPARVTAGAAEERRRKRPLA